MTFGGLLLLAKRLPADYSSAAAAEPTAKRRTYPANGSTSASTSSPPSMAAAAAKPQVLFRILCPATKTGGVIGKGGAIIRQFREETGARIRIDDSVTGCDERVILIVADAVKSKREVAAVSRGAEGNDGEESVNLRNFSPKPMAIDDDESSPAQQALVRVFERILKVDEEREEKEKKEDLSCLVVCSGEEGRLWRRLGRRVDSCIA